MIFFLIIKYITNILLLMGVPGFFVWLLEHSNNDILINDIENLHNIDNLYFDANCLFHPKCFDILKLHENITDNEVLESLMIERIIKYIDWIIKYVNPLNLIYIGVDGVAPLAKINQQRKRRYKSVIDNEYYTYLNNKYNIKKNTSWSNIVITPGTLFMKKLDLELQKYSKLNKKIIYSSYNESGEGEHKIIRFIKKNNNFIKKTHLIYGLDADLIFLAISIHSIYNNVYLLRELQHLKNIKTEVNENVKEPLCFLSIENVINSYNKIIIDKININNDYSKDFIILCFLIGNDFIPHIPSINIKMSGIDYLIEAYINMFINLSKYIYQNNKLNWDCIKYIFKYLKSIEENYFMKILPKHKKYILNKQCNYVDEYNIELWNHDNLKNIKIENINKNENFNFNMDEYKFNYYKTLFNSSINQKKFINKICKNYLEMLEWITNYYFSETMPSYRYCYNFNNAPFVSDLYDYLIYNNIEYNIEYLDPIDINTQLLLVIPKKYHNLINIKNKINIKTKYMFPIDYELDYYNKDQYWMCEPKLPMIDLDLLKK
jgi:5'-3' exonuclease